MNGVININKAAGWTSQDVCAKLRSRLHIKKIGHTGTLDPMATGVLPVCIGKATRIIEYYDADYKSYHASMQLGVTSDTLDITGEILSRTDYTYVTDDTVTEAFKAYTGMVEQIPPRYSALRIDGKRAYELAREGRDFELKAREVEIVENEIKKIDLRSGIIEFDVTCSKGSYIRSMIDDIGRSLGCGAVMTALVRTASGFFGIEDALSIEEIVDMSDEEIKQHIIPMEETLINLGKVTLNDNRVTAFINGNSSSPGTFRIMQQSAMDNLYRVYGSVKTADESDNNLTGNCFIGIGLIKNSSLIPVKVLANL